MKKYFLSIFIVFISFILLSSCGKKAEIKNNPTPVTNKVVEMPLADRPDISLTPRADGHLLLLKISKVPSYISQIEYEVLYTATDKNSEIEKGVGDTIKDVTSTIERSLLLGTESCTNGCKYKYDEGVNGGTVILKFINKNGQVSIFETPFTLKSTAQIVTDGKINLSVENFSVTPKSKLTGKDFFILIKNYKGGYSVFSNSSNSLVGNYTQS